MHPWLAIVCFFRALFGRPLPAAAAAGALPGPGALDEARRAGALAALALLQRDGRLIDFLEEDIEGYKDDQVGAAVRDVHRGCRKTLREHFDLGPVIDSAEGGKVPVPKGFDPGAIRLTGAVKGEPPFEGTLRHPGWRASRVELPASAAGIVAPAEVEL